MAIVTHPQMLTGNRLRDGEVLYWKEGDWVLTLEAGQVFTDPASAQAALLAAQAFVTGNKVVGVYLFEVEVEGSVIHPIKERERIRAAGPTVQRHMGKQAGQYHVQV
jgi:hypothetical protein